MQNTLLPRVQFALCATLLAASCFAQKVPVSVVGFENSNEDQTAIRLSRSLSDEIQLSAKFYRWTGDDLTLPPNGIRIMMTSIRVTLQIGREMGSVIVLQATRPSAKDPGYYKFITQQTVLLPKTDSVTEISHGFLADLDRMLSR